MQAVDKTKKELATEVAHLRQRVAELEKSGVVLEKEAILDTLMEHVIHEDREMRILWANKAACNSVGLSLEELIGRHCYEIWPKRSDPCPDCPVVKAMETGQLQEVEKETSDGRCWFIRGYPLRDEKDNIVGGIEFTLEITERKQAERELWESEERFRTIFEGAPDAIFLADPESGVILDVNPAASHLLSRPHEEIIGLHQSQLHPLHMEKYARETFIEHLQQIRRKKQLRPIESAVIRSDGTEVPVEVLAQIVRINGKHVIQGTFRDITERKRSEDELRESEERYRFLFENSQTINLLIGIDGKILDVNESAIQSLGYNKKSIIGKEVIEFVIPDQREKVAQQLALELQGEYTPPLEIDIFTKKGTRTLLFTEGHATLFEKGELTGMLLSAVDITDRKQAEEKLRESEERFRTICETAQDFIALKDRDCKFTYLNPAIERNFGIPTSKLIGKTSAALFGKKRSAHIIEEDLRVLKGEIINEEHPSPIEGSSTIHHIIKVPIRNSAGEIIGLCNIGRDITERKQMEEELRESEERFRRVVETMEVGLGAIDENGVYTYVNEYLCKMLGYSMEEMIARSALDFFYDEESRKAQEEIFAKRKAGMRDTTPYEIIFRRKNGQKVYAILSPTPSFDPDGRFTGSFAIHTDITERKRMEEELRESSERFRTIVETAPSLLMISDQEGKNIYVSPNCEEITGYKQEELLGTMQWWVHEDDIARAKKVYARTFREAVGGKDFEYKAVRKNGELWYASSSWEALKDSEGKFKGAVMQTVDITERKQAEEKLRESEEKYRSLVESSEDSIYLIDNECKYIFLNDKYLSRLGMKSNQVVGRAYDEFHAPEESKDFAQRIKTVLKTGTSQTYEYQSQRDNRYFIRTLSPVTSPDGGGIKAITVISKDITEHKQAEEKLRASEERFRAIFETAQDLIFLKDRNLKFTAVNPATERYYGVSDLELVGKTTTSLLGKKVGRLAKEEDLRVLGGEIIDTEHSFQLQGKTVIQNVIKVPIRNSAGEIIGLCGTVRDITERKLAEEELVRIREAVEGSSDGIGMSDPEGHHFFQNRAFSNLFEWSTAEELEAAGGGPAAYVDKDVANDVFSTIMDGRSWSGEVDMVSKNGRRFPVLLRADAIRDDAGRTIGLIGIHTDITRRKEAEEALREREAFNYALFQYNPIETIVVDLEGRVTGFNLAKQNSGDKLPTKGDRMYEDYASKHGIDMRAELMGCISSGEIKGFPEQKYGDKYLSITISPFSQGAIIISEDITERKRTEDALRESEHFSSSLLNGAPHPIIVINQDTSIRYVNPALEKLTGFSEAELIGRKAPYPYWNEEIVSETTRGLQRAFNQRSQKREQQYHTKRGDQFLVDIISEPIIHDGKVQYLLANWTDITERKQAEELLQKERDNLYSILERAPYGVMVLDADSNLSFVNTEFVNITGYTQEDIRPAKEWMHRAYPDKHYRDMVKETWKIDYTQSRDEETFRKRFGRSFSRAFTVICKDGAAKEIEFRTAMMGDEGTVLMLSDITDRKRLHDLLETAAAEWRTTFDAINDAVCLLDPYGKIVRCNNAMLQIMGKSFSQITNHHCWEVIHGVSEAPKSCPIARVEKTHKRETEVMFKDERWINISVDPLLDEDGNLIGGVHIMSDITDRMRIQNELQESREQLRDLTVYLESVREQERTNIAREIHDELAQALTALKMDVSWIDHRLPSDLQSISEKTKSMSSLIDSTIKTVKRISAELRPGILDDLGLVAAIEWQAEEFQNRTNVKCRVTIDPEDIIVDQDRSTAIFRIFQETLINVARHAHATHVTVGLKEKAGKLTLRVRDNGTGITEEQIYDQKSFGLIGIRERVHPWGGKVSIKGIPGKGTTVLVSVGLARSKIDLEKIKSNGSLS